MLMLMVMAVTTVEHGIVPEKAFAGGGINYKLTMQNPTDHDCKITVWVHQVVQAYPWQVKTVPAQSTATFETGAWCILGVTGKIYSKLDQQWFEMQDTTCEGYNMSVGLGIPHCFDVHMEVVKKAGIGHDHMRDNDYGFRDRTR